MFRQPIAAVVTGLKWEEIEMSKTKNSRMAAWLLALAMIFSLLGITSSNVLASGSPEPLVITYNSSTMEITWNPVNGVTEYFTFVELQDGLRESVAWINSPDSSGVYRWDVSGAVYFLGTRNLLNGIPAWVGESETAVIGRQPVQSNVLTIPITPLSMPQNVRVSGNTLFWDPVPGASHYHVIAGNTVEFTTDVTQRDLSGLGTQVVHNVAVRALNGATNSASPISEYVVYAGTENQIIVNSINPEFGIASSNVSSATQGATVTLSATANTGYRFVRWEVASGSISLSNVNSANATFTMPNTAVSVMAVFEATGSVVTTSVNNTEWDFYDQQDVVYELHWDEREQRWTNWEHESIYQWNRRRFDAMRTDEETLAFYLQPELFWYSEHTRYRNSDADEVVALAGTITSGISGDYEKTRAISEWVSANVWYDLEQLNYDNFPVSVLEKRRAVCSGYAGLTEALLRAAGIPAKTIFGYVSHSYIAHEWVEAFVDGRWIIIDSTSNSMNRYENGVFSPQQAPVSTYFDISLWELSISHVYTNGPDRSIRGSFVVTNGLEELIGTTFDQETVTEIIVPDGILSIGNMALSDYSNLRRVALPESLVKIASAAFLGSNSLTDVNIPAGVTSIGDYAFSMTSLADIKIPTGVTVISEGAFSSNQSLTSIVIPDGVTEIGALAFIACLNLESVVIPPSVREIKDDDVGLGAFYRCPNLTIYGVAGSYAQTYAIAKNIPFVAGTPSDTNTQPPASLPSRAMTVNPTPSTVFVNGDATAFEAYIIDGSNFFKLRDLAFVLNGTEKQFSVGYDNVTRAITLTSGGGYVPDGSEMALGDGTAKSATLNAAINISKDGKPVEITAYLIGGNNFMRLRDVMALLDVGVGYDAVTRNITVETSMGYVED